MKRINISRMATAIGVAGVLGVASLAIAADKKSEAAPAVTKLEQLPTLANVRVVNATPAQLARLAKERASSTEGMRAFVDPVSRQLRPATPDDMAAPAAAAPSAPVQTFGLSGGGVGARLSDEHMAYSVAHIDADGKVRQECLEDKQSAEAALKAGAPKGDSHEK